MEECLDALLTFIAPSKGYCEILLGQILTSKPVNLLFLVIISSLNIDLFTFRWRLTDEQVVSRFIFRSGIEQ